MTRDVSGQIYDALRATEIEFSALSTGGFNIYGDRKSIEHFTLALNSLGREEALQRNLRHWRDEVGKLHAKLSGLRDLMNDTALDDWQRCNRIFEALKEPSA